MLERRSRPAPLDHARARTRRQIVDRVEQVWPGIFQDELRLVFHAQKLAQGSFADENAIREKFKEMGSDLYLDADKVKESNRAL